MKIRAKKSLAVAAVATLISSGGCPVTRPAANHGSASRHNRLANQTPQAVAVPDLFQSVREHIEILVGSGHIPSLAVAVARSGNILWEEGFGLADRESSTPATEHTSYPIASISKPLTATALMILVEKGVVDLDAPINDYLGDARLQTRVGEVSRATVRRVTSHTAGLPLHSQHYYDDEPRQAPPMAQTARRYGNLVTAPGERYQYSNLGYGLLGEVIAGQSGRHRGAVADYADVMREEVFMPLGMSRTSVRLGPGLQRSQAVKYTRDGLVIPPCHSDTPAASDVYSSAHDLACFAMFHLKDHVPGQIPILSDCGIEMMQEASPETSPTRAWERAGSGYGIGWFVSVAPNGLRLVHHNGGILGASSVLTLVPREDVAIVVLSNTDSHWPDDIVFEILSALMPESLDGLLPSPTDIEAEPRRPPPMSTSGLWVGFVQTYDGEMPLTLEVAGSNDIAVTLGGEGPTPLRDVSYEDAGSAFLNAGGGPYLRGWMKGKIPTEDVLRGEPTKLWLELRLRGDSLTGTLIAFSQRQFHTGPLSHWVELMREQSSSEGD